MKLDKVDKLVPLGLISIFTILILLRILGIIPHIIATDEFEVSRTLLMDGGVGTLVSVFSIVISLSLMGVQTASQEYTHRIMKTYLKSVMLWSMFVIYIGTVLYNIYMVAFLQPVPNTLYTDIAVLLISLCLVMLIPHFLIGLAYLKPDSIIDIILKAVDREYIAHITGTLEQHEQLADSDDRLLPAVEIIEKCIGKGDRATVRVALDSMYNSFTRNVDSRNEDSVTRYFLDYFLRIGREALIEKDDDSLVQVLGIMRNISEGVSSPGITKAAIEDISDIGLGAAKEEFDGAVEQMIDSLKKIVQTRKSDDTVTMTLDTYDGLSLALFPLRKKGLIIHLLDALMELGKMIVEKRSGTLTTRYLSVVEGTGISAIREKIREASHHVVLALCEFGCALARNGEASARYAVESLIRLEREAGVDRELVSEIDFAKKQVESCIAPEAGNEKGTAGLDTSDLWR